MIFGGGPIHGLGQAACRRSRRRRLLAKQAGSRQNRHKPNH
jgi:hypothetical protein